MQTEIHPKVNQINIIIKPSSGEKKIPVLSTLEQDYVIYQDYLQSPAWNKSGLSRQDSSKTDKFSQKFGNIF